MSSDKTQRVILDVRFPSFNQVIEKAKSHYAAYSTMKRRLTNMVWARAKEAELKRVQGPQLVRFWIYEKDARRDLDGAMAMAVKCSLDGLVEAGVLPDDNRKWVSGLEFRFPEPDRKRPRVEVELIPEPTLGQEVPLGQ